MSNPIRSPRADDIYSEGGFLVRNVLPRSGRRYEHRCSRAGFAAVVTYIEEHATEGVTCGDLWRYLEDVPASAAAVALAFLKERGCVVTRRKRSYPASDVFAEDAMCEFWALAESRPSMTNR